jgi:hypothetical protein
MPDPNMACPVCAKRFYMPAWQRSRGGTYCSYECRNTGRGVTAETRAKMSAAQQARGKRSAETRARMSAAQMRHGESRDHRTVLYRLWRNIQSRCFNPRIRDFYLYGGRGITMWEPWRVSYEQFSHDILTTLGERPSQHHSIDRVAVDGHYEPGNLRWATKREQTLNRRA